jgi:hypothetical protein
MIEASPSQPSPANRFLDKALVASVLTTLALASGPGPAKTAEAAPAHAAGLSDCTRYFDVSTYRNHEGEVCTAYVANSAEVALQGFYKFGNNRVSYLASPARHHFQTRYWGGPRRSIEREVDSWPSTDKLLGNKVKESIDVVSVSSNLKADRGLVRTRESWKVTAPNGDTLHQEAKHTRDVTMCRGRLPGHILHEWMVVKYSRDPTYDCIAFDKRHDITP